MHSGKDVRRFSLHILDMSERPRDCWEWGSATNASGYGVFTAAKKTYIASRFAWEVAEGPIPPGLFVCHTCDNRLCVRREHLFLGTHADNMRDRAAKNRFGPLKRSPRAHFDARLKLTDAKVATIRESYATGRFTQRALAQKYGVHQSQIWAIVTNRQRKLSPA